MVKRVSLLSFILLMFNAVYAQKSVAIIGGGMSGIAAVHYLMEQDQSIEITVFEKHQALGGNAQTVPIKNAEGKMMEVDVGPQYFAEGPWDEYISLLKEYDLYEGNTWGFEGSFSIYDVSTGRRKFVSPLGGTLRKESLKNLLAFKRFYKASRKLFKKKEVMNVSVEEWMEGIRVSSVFRDEIAYPFLASSLGTTIDEIKLVSAQDLVKLFAFNPALKKGEFFILQKGMGNAIQIMGEQLKKRGLIVRNGIGVVALKQNDGKTTIYSENGKEGDFDFVISTVHSDQLAQILATGKEFPELKESLHGLPYFEAHIVIHSDARFTNAVYPSFLNVQTDSSGNLLSNTMNLSMIEQEMKGIYKSWLSDSDLKKVKENGTYLADQVFFHPMITTGFMQSLEIMKAKESSIPNFAVAGGWTERLETQETAIRSAKRAVQKCVNYFNSAK